MKLLKKSLLVALTLLLVSCAAKNSIVLYPITGEDFYRNDKGDYCMTEFYLNEVLDAKIEGN